MIPQAPPGLRKAILDFVDPTYTTRRGFVPPPISGDVEEDLKDFRLARVDGANEAHPFFAATFRDEDDSSRLLDVLVAPALRGYEVSRLLAALSHSQVPVRSVSDNEALDIVADRASEFIAVRSGAVRGAGGAGSSNATVVDSNRSGDTIVFCKGYFVSTATGFGVSTPATKTIPRGRYSFGIVEANGSHRFDRTLWTCPARLRLRLP